MSDRRCAAQAQRSGGRCQRAAAAGATLCHLHGGSPRTPRIGRPSKLTDAVQATIVALVQSGNFLDVAAEAAGVDASTFFRWLQRGEDPRAPRMFRMFREAVTRARQEAEAQMVLHVKLAAQQGDWKAAAFWLERSRRERWGRSDAAAAVVNVHPPERLDLAALSDEELLAFERLTAKARGPGGPALPAVTGTRLEPVTTDPSDEVTV